MSAREQVAAVARQIGAIRLEDSDQWFNRFEISSTSSNRRYVIAQRRSDDVWGCSCPGWRNRRYCKHVTDVLARLAAVASAGLVPEVQQMLASARTAYLDLSGPATISAPRQTGRALDLGGN